MKVIIKVRVQLETLRLKFELNVRGHIKKFALHVLRTFANGYATVVTFVYVF